MRNTCARAYCNCTLWFFATNQQHAQNQRQGAKSPRAKRGLVYDINAPYAFGLRESKPNAMHAYGRSCAPIAQGLVYDINAPHVFGLRDSKPNVMHAYGRSSAPIAQGLVYDINDPHAFGLRQSKRIRITEGRRQGRKKRRKGGGRNKAS